MNNIELKALELGEEVAQKLGVYIVDTEYDKDILCYYIDCDGGVGIDKCEEFSRAVEEILDREDIIDKEYSLEVSSPGVDRKLKTEREFNYYKGREVEVKLYAPLDGVKEFDGVLTGFENKTVTVEVNGKSVEIPQKDAVYVKLKFVF